MDPIAALQDDNENVILAKVRIHTSLNNCMDWLRPTLSLNHTRASTVAFLGFRVVSFGE